MQGQPESLIFITNRATYTNPYEFSEKEHWICHVSPEEAGGNLSNKHAVIIVFKESQRVSFIQALEKEGNYDTHIHYVWPSEVKDTEQLAERFAQFLAPFELANGTGSLDLIAEEDTLPFIRKAFEKRSGRKGVLSTLFILLKGIPSIQFMSHGSSINKPKLLMDIKPSAQGQLLSNPSISKQCQNVVTFNAAMQTNPKLHFLETRSSSIHRQPKKVSIPRHNDYEKIYQIIAATAHKHMRSPGKRTLDNVILVNDCKDLISTTEIASRQGWRQETAPEKYYPLFKGKNVAMIVHGMANTINDAYDSYNLILSHIETSYDYVIYYLWPGAGVWPYPSYNNAQNEKGNVPFARVLEGLTKSQATVDVLAHSMGCKLTLESLQKSTMTLNNFFMFAPAIPEDCFKPQEGIYFEASKRIHKIAVFWTDKDLAMLVFPFMSFAKPIHNDMSFLTQGLGSGVSSVNHLPNNILVVNVSQMEASHGLTTFDGAFPMVPLIANFLRGKPQATMSHLKTIVDKHFEENGYKRYTRRTELTNGDFLHPVCEFNGSTDTKKYEPLAKPTKRPGDL